MLNERKKFNERDHYSKNPTYNAIKRFNKIRNTCVRADKSYDYEISKEIYLIEPHDNDLYIQN